MPIVLIVGVAALLLVAAVLFVLRRRQAAAEDAAAVEVQPERRRAGALVSAPVEPTAAADPRAVADGRARREIGLSPWEGGVVAAEHHHDVSPDDADLSDEAAEDLIHEDAAPAAAVPLDGFDADRLIDDPVLATPIAAPDSAPIPDLGSLPDPAPANDPEPASADEPPSILSQLKTKKKAGPNLLAGAAEGAPEAAPSGPPVPSEVEESVSLVLRRQVPVHPGPPRSWLGGLPMMPDGLEWPRSVAPEQLEGGEIPLNFVAQICCADLPPDLWAGLGPRDGWLLLFLNPRDSQGDDPRLLRLIHSDSIGTERQPPADLPPVVDADYADADFLWHRSAAEIPGTWRRWPVDLVSVANDAHDDGYRVVVTPKDYAATLYEGAPVESGRPDIGDEVPFSWRGALYAVDSALRALAAPVAAARVAPAIRDVLDKPGYLASLVPELRAREALWLSEGEGAILSKEEPLRERERELRERVAPIAEARKQAIDRLAAFIAANPGGTALIRAIEQGADDERAWREAAAGQLAAIRDGLAARPLDTPLSGEDWDRLAETLDQQAMSRWTADWASRNSDLPVMLTEQRLSLLDLARPGIEAGVVELAADYQADETLAGLVPPHFIEGLSPYWRQLTDNRPHRIGGFHDGLQSDPEPGPQAELLLFQIASDEAMRWNWGDGGAYFVTLSPRDLAAGRFERAEIRLEQP